MKLNAPKQIVWLISILLGVLGLIGQLVTVPYLTAYAFWLVLVGLVLLALGNILKGF